MRERLPLHEWFFVIAILGFIGCLCIYSNFSSKDTSCILREEGLIMYPEEMVSVSIIGEVKKPGIYKFFKGTFVKDAVRKAKLKRFAYIDGFGNEERVQANKTIVVPSREKITIFLSGEVLISGSYTCRAHTRVCDLKKMGIFRENADLAALKSRRELRHGEELYIPALQERK